ncbi:MAG: rhodanese-like domain-containing protein [Campylobacterota bacterium]|nr:rhodanese-like domain-containing protein [Campylobacterota bacterium]
MKLIISLLLTTLTLLSADAFITAEYLKKHLNDKNLVLLDTTDPKTFAKGHIPNARQASISLFRHWVDNTYLLINSPEKIQKAITDLGINSNSKVIIYGHNNNKELLKSSYIALALIAHGFTNVSILDGGYGDWKYEFEGSKGMISTSPTSYEKGDFVIKFNPNVLVGLAYVKEHIGKVPMIEARPKVYFDGSKKSNGVKRLGHIPQAQSSYWRDKFNVDDTLKSDKKLKAIFLNEHALDPHKEVIAYCTGGLEASMNWFVLTQHLGFKDVKIYDASLKEWGNLDSTPMTK